MSNKITTIPLVSQHDLSLIDNNILNGKQLQFLVKNTPAKYIHERPAKGGGSWKYVSGGYVRKMLNYLFGWQWSFEIQEQLILHGEAIVKGKLTVVSNGVSIAKMQFGNKDIMYKKQVDENGHKVPLSIGNDLKAAATDALKKCAAELGIAADIYNAQDFQAVAVLVDDDTITHESLSELFEIKRESLSVEQIASAERIISNKEVKSYTKLFKELQSC